MSSRTRDVPLTRGRTDPEGRRLCCHCAEPLPKRRRDWCSDECALRYRIRKGEQSAARYWLEVVQKQKACALCGVATLADPDVAQQIRATHHVVDGRRARQELRRRHSWDADHVHPIAEGGALHETNLRMLCRPCHRRETAALRKRLAAARRRGARP